MRLIPGGPGAGLIVIALAWPLSAVAAEGRSDAWRHDFESAESEARQLGRPMVVHFHAKWCGPCQEMEYTVLRDPVLLKQLHSGFVAVKVDSDERPDLRKHFRVEKLPTDLFIDPRGYVLDRSSGVHDREWYQMQLARLEAVSGQMRSTRIVSQTKPLFSESARTNESRMPLAPVPPPIAPDPAGPRGVEPVPIAAAIASHPAWESNRRAERRWISLGMKGFSPVALSSQRQWVQGDHQFAAEYKGVVYFLASADELQRFRDSPDRFAPQMLGCDPVILDIADRAVPGDIRYAAYFDGQLYLFVSNKSRELFQNDPRRFVRAKHVLKMDDLDEKRLE